MTLLITAACATQLAEHAAHTYPEECVGLLLGQYDQRGRWALEILRLVNRWQAQLPLTESEYLHSRNDRFYLDPLDYLHAERLADARGLLVVGMYHSHPDAAALPSERDRVGAQVLAGASSFSFVIQSVYAGQSTELRSWLLRSDGEAFEAEELIVSEP